MPGYRLGIGRSLSARDGARALRGAVALGAIALIVAVAMATAADAAGPIVAHGQNAATSPHHWGSVFGAGVPKGAVIGGPAPRTEVRTQGFHAKSPFDSRFATYEDRRVNYVTSEPAIDYAASSILLIAALEGRC